MQRKQMKTNVFVKHNDFFFLFSCGYLKHSDGAVANYLATTKYVRREIRTLSTYDREAYFKAMQIMFTTSEVCPPPSFFLTHPLLPILPTTSDDPDLLFFFRSIIRPTEWKRTEAASSPTATSPRFTTRRTTTTTATSSSRPRTQPCRSRWTSPCWPSIPNSACRTGTSW